MTWRRGQFQKCSPDEIAAAFSKQNDIHTMPTAVRHVEDTCDSLVWHFPAGWEILNWTSWRLRTELKHKWRNWRKQWNQSWCLWNKKLGYRFFWLSCYQSMGRVETVTFPGRGSTHSPQKQLSSVCWMSSSSTISHSIWPDFPTLLQGKRRVEEDLMLPQQLCCLSLELLIVPAI